MNKALRNPLVFILFVIPALVLFIMFFIYPIFSSLYYSFTSWNGVSDTVKYAGLDNFKKPWGMNASGFLLKITAGSFCSPYAFRCR